MDISKAEKDRRFRSVYGAMRRDTIDVLLMVGDAAKVSTRTTGGFRYLTGFFVYASYSFLLLFMDEEPVILAPSENSRYWASKRSWIKDVRLSGQKALDIVKVINEKTKKDHGKLGIVSTASLPPDLFVSLQQDLPKWQVVDADPILFEITSGKSEEEELLLRQAGEIVDAGYRAVLKMIRPGLKEYEIVGFLEGFFGAQGCDKTFNLISSGPFPGDKQQGFPTLPSSPSDREIRKGDVICLEITAGYKGYWNQLVREVVVGQENPYLASFHKALVETVRAGVASMKPGVKTSDFVGSMENAAIKAGFGLTPPMGHYAGLDLMEGPVSAESRLVLRSGSCAIIHPCLSDGTGNRVFWGETYIVRETQTSGLNQSSNELVVL